MSTPSTFEPAVVQAIIFDYGNTIIPYGREALAHYGDQVFIAMETHYGPLDRKRFDEIRQASRMHPYAGDPPAYRENDMAAITTELVRVLHGAPPTPEVLEALLRVRHEAFVNAVSVDTETVAALQALSKRFPLGLLSNYPDALAIRSSLDKLSLTKFFTSIVISGELGYVKPHPIMFAKSLEELRVPAFACLFVGDNWLADVQGAKAVGMQVAHMQRWNPPEDVARSGEDHQPELQIRSLVELAARLLG